jgi:hypothetical protein
VHLSMFPFGYFPDLLALHERDIIHGDISLDDLFLGMTEETGFIGDLDPGKEDLGIIKKVSS